MNAKKLEDQIVKFTLSNISGLVVPVAIPQIGLNVMLRPGRSADSSGPLGALSNNQSIKALIAARHLEVMIHDSGAKVAMATFIAASQAIVARNPVEAVTGDDDHQRRAGSITHVKTGSETWEPTTEETGEILNAFVAAEEPPAPAVGTITEVAWSDLDFKLTGVEAPVVAEEQTDKEAPAAQTPPAVEEKSAETTVVVAEATPPAAAEEKAVVVEATSTETTPAVEESVEEKTADAADESESDEEDGEGEESPAASNSPSEAVVSGKKKKKKKKH